MSYDKVRASQKCGRRYKASSKSNASWFSERTFCALDADNWVTDSAISFAREIGIPVILVESKKELGKACGIHVGAAVVSELL